MRKPAGGAISARAVLAEGSEVGWVGPPIPVSGVVAARAEGRGRAVGWRGRGEPVGRLPVGISVELTEAMRIAPQFLA